LLGENGDFIFSAGLTYHVKPFSIVPELLRTELTMRWPESEIKAGRMPYMDPAGIIAEGFFDGALFSYDTRAGTFSIGSWYTGLLYKTRAAIVMTENELQAYYKELDYSDFANTYFAPKRILSTIGWEHLSLGGLFSAQFALLGQFDLSGTNLHSQYLSGKIAMPFRQFIFDAKGCFELIECGSEIAAAFAGGMGVTWILPVRNEQHISLRGIFSNGADPDKSIAAFLPLSAITQGNLLKAKLSGLSVIYLSHLAKVTKAISTDLSAAYFVRSDLGTYTEYPVIGINSEGYFLGPEFFARFIWSLSTGIQMNLGGGTFLPSLGNAAPENDILWRAELNVIISVY